MSDKKKAFSDTLAIVVEL